jgi:hypothetical protein
MPGDSKKSFSHTHKKLPSLKEDDYWVETINNVAAFTGVYLDERFKIRYSFKTREWIGLDDEEPFKGYAELLKWELYLHEGWLPQRNQPNLA